MPLEPPEPCLKDALVDHIARMNLQLLSELWITRDRLAILEAVLEKNDVLASGSVDQFEPDQALLDKLSNLRELMTSNVMGASQTHLRSVQSLIEIGKTLESIGGRPSD